MRCLDKGRGRRGDLSPRGGICGLARRKLRQEHLPGGLGLPVGHRLSSWHPSGGCKPLEGAGLKCKLPG